MMRWEQMPEIPLFSDNTAAFTELSEIVAAAAGDPSYTERTWGADHRVA
jgi:hypothetical protein